MDIGQRIRMLRKAKGMTQNELACELKIANSTMSQYETGARTPSDDMKMAIANYFDVTIDYLLGREEGVKKPTPVSGDGQNPLDKRLNELLSQSSDETKKAMIALLEQLQRR